MIIGFIGGIGSSKTLSMTELCYKDFIKGSRIFTNYGLRFGKNNRIEYLTAEFFDDYAKSGLDLNKAFIAIDEAHVFIDSRNSLSKRNKVMMRFVTQSRKRGVTLGYTTQDISVMNFKQHGQVDLRLRKLTDYLVFCRYKKIGSGKNIKHISVQDWHDQAGRPLGRKIKDLSYITGKYDTNEIVDIM